MRRPLCAALVALTLLAPTAASARHRHVHHRAHIAHVVARTSVFGQTDVVAEARRYLGAGAIFGRSTLWCARFMNFVLAHTGHPGTGSDLARSFDHYGRPVGGPVVGAIAVMGRGHRGGHVGVVSGIAANGDPILISGNHGRRVVEAQYPRGRIYRYVMP